MRVDFIFSYWIVLWYIAYVIKFTKFSPKFALLIGIIENLILLCFMIYKKTDINSLIRFSIGNFIIKVLPFSLLYDEFIKKTDIIFTFVLFVIYNAWLYVNNETFIDVVIKTTDSLIHNKNYTPFMKLLHWLE